MRSRLKKISLFLILSVFLFGAVSVVQAQIGDPNPGDTFGVAQIGETVKLSSDDPREIAGRIINIALGLLGLITVGLVLYGGFLYMTSAGDDEKISTGKKYIINATIGLVIILSAWAIVQFVFKQLNDAIVGDGGGTPVGDEDLPPDACDPDSDSYNAAQCENYCEKNPEYSLCEDTVFYVKAITPGIAVNSAALTTGMNNIAVRVLFSHALAADTVASKIVVIQEKDSVDPLPITTAIAENGRVAEIYYAPSGSPVPFNPNKTYVVTVNREIEDKFGNSLEADYQSGAYPIVAQFTADTAFNDTVKPMLSGINLNGFSGDTISFAKGTALTVSGQIFDRQNTFGGNGLVKISIAAASGGSAIQTVYAAPKVTFGSSAAYQFNYTLPLDKKFAVGQKYIVTITGHDIDNNLATASISFTVKGAHCSNDIQDADETGVDSGGSCGGGEGDSCNLDTDCASGFQCINKTCRAVPVITGVDPLSGAPGNWVTVMGKNFGNKAGKVEFGVDANANGAYETSEWFLATVVQCSGKGSWNDRWAVVVVPELAMSAKAAIRITTEAGKTDSTIDAFGTKPGGTGLFSVTNNKKPGLCAVSVTVDTVIDQNNTQYTLFAGDTFAPPGVGVQAIGTGFGNSASGNTLTFGATKKADDTLIGGVIGEIVSNYWTDTTVRTRVPANYKAGLVAVHLRVNGAVSNGVPFQVLATDMIPSVPQISAISPATSTALSFVTIQGKGFGNTTGQVYLASSANTVKTCDTGTPDASCRLLKVTNLSAQCTQNWTDTQIVAQLPDAAALGTATNGSLKNFNVLVKTAGPPVQKTAGQETVLVEYGPPGIGLCQISPNRGPAPLPADSAPINIFGINVPPPTDLEVIYWKAGAVANPNTNSGIDGWLYSLGDLTPDGQNPIVSGFPNGTGFSTRLPVDTNGQSMSSGPIRVLDAATGRWSNAVNYTVESCIGSKTNLPGYRCCASGPEAGQWKKNNLSCAGEARAAGYTWRFMTGILANQPQVVEQCNDVDSPSPTPRLKETSNPITNSCVNATIALRFNMGMDTATLNKDTVKLFACATGPGNTIDCDEKKTAVTLDADDITYQTGANTLIIREAPPKGNLEPNTWYQVELSNKITALEHATVLGVNQQIKTPLVATRSCGNGTSYCFAFKTNSSECTLAGAGINPAQYTARSLGILQDPRYPNDASQVFTPPNLPPNPYYYFLWGKGNQECSMVSSQLLDSYPWEWSPKEGFANSDLATVYKAPVASAPGVAAYNNIRALVNARAQTAPDSVTIKAEAQINNNQNLNTDVGGSNVLQLAGLTVGATGFAPTGPTTLPAGPSEVLGLQNTFALQLKFAQPEKSTFPNNVLLQKVNTSVPGKPTGYIIKFVNNQICLNPFAGSGSSVDLCATVIADDKGVYNVILVGDKTKNTLSWVDLVPTNRPVYPIALAAIPNSGNALAILAAEKNPLTAKGPVYYSMQVSGSLPGFLAGNSSFVLSPTSNLIIDLADPVVTYYEPNCIESCNNASIRVDFNRQMATSTYADGFVVYKCMDGVVCASTQLTSIYTVDRENSTQTTLRAHLSPTGPNLEANQYYKVSLNKNNLAIKSLAKVNPVVYGKPLPPTEWIFKTRADAKPCSVGFLQVTPLDLVASTIGQQDQYTVVPYSAPNACSKVGQALNKWAYQYAWSTANTEVAKISQLPAAQYSNISPSCTVSCVKKGSTIASDSSLKNAPVCGNGLVEAGEDCEISSASETPGKSCGLNCLRPGNVNGYSAENTGTGVCGNGQVESTVGEQCDPGNANGKVKADSATCTANCLLRGSSATVSNVPGVAVCGDGEITAGQETCDIADPISKNGCSAQCVKVGTKTGDFWCQAQQVFKTDSACRTAVSVCGNGKIENSEDCEVGVNGVTVSMCSKSCQFIDACALSNPPCAKNAPGCSSGCTLLGAKSSYSAPSVCGDRVVGTGENPSCELTITNALNAAEAIGPTQIVQAVGRANPVAGTNYQQTTVNATTKDNNKIVSGQANYRLQCGYKEYNFATVDNSYNNCPVNSDNNLGVGANSCCVPRPRVASQYPTDGAGFVGSESVCRNTKIEAVFDRAMQIDSLSQNIFLVTGHTAANFNCAAVQGQNFTDTVAKIVASAPITEQGFWAGLWQKVTTWTRNLLVDEAGATSVAGTQEFKAIKTWCAGEIPTTITAQTENNNSITRVSIAVSKTLDPETIYGVVLRGDVGGIVDLGGVPMKALGSSARNDAWFFKTSAAICKIKEVGVNPNSHVFVSPNSSQTFTAFASSTNGQSIVSTPNYAWTWSWAPNPNAVFDFIQDGSKPSNVLEVRAKTVPGKIMGVAAAKVTADTSADNNQLGQVFNEAFQLEALFCERPWPANPNYPLRDTTYNFETGYCADAGKAGDTNDDLPYLREQILQAGPVSSDSLKKMVFFNDKNSDVIGVQIFASDKPLNEWFSETQKFGSAASFRSEVVGEYQALTDGNNYYVQALNYEPGSTAANDDVKSYVYLFSINPNADAKTRQVFSTLLQRLTFNINLSNHNYCLVAGGTVRTNPNAINATQCVTDFDCRDATGAPKADVNNVLSSGTCSNVRTKFLRDWKRLNDLQVAQDNLDTFFATQGTSADFKGTLAGGSFVPGYTVSKWAESWGRLQQMTGVSFSDPINRWSTCSAEDPQTCWSASSTTYYCPNFKSVYEYEYLKANNSYKIHAPLEFFRTSDKVTQDYLNIERFTTAPWAGCASGAYNPFSEKCGDGILNQNEQCDPPGTIELADTKVETTFDRCSQWAESKACKVDSDCGSLFQTSGRYINGVFKVGGGATGVCVGKNGSALTITRGTDAQKREYEMLSCSTNAECDSFVTAAKAAPGNFNNTHGALSFHPTADKNSYFPVSPQYQVLNGAPLQQFLADSGNKLTCDTTSFKTTNKYHLVGSNSFCTFNAFNPIIKNNPTLNAKGEYELFACNRNEDCRTMTGSYSQSSGSVLFGVGGIMRSDAELDYDLKQNINSLFTCQPTNTVVTGDSVRFDSGKSSCSVATVIPQACSDGELVKRTCNNQCTWQYGSCASAGSCGNGKVEGAEVCDDGALNDTYGHCNAICTGLAAGRCGNGKKDFVDSAKKTLEFCEGGLDGFTAKYNLDRTKSCSWDCRTFGGYCGDGYIQTESGEACDDGNNTDDAKCMANCQLPALSCLNLLVNPTSGSALYGIKGPPTSTTTFLPYTTNKYTFAGVEEDFQGETQCSAATPRQLCAAAGLTCKNVIYQNKNGVTVAVGCKDPFSGTAIENTDLKKLVLEEYGTTKILGVECNGMYNVATADNNQGGPSCGNGITEKVLGEECDAGAQNDVQCVPSANEDRCYYCGNGCKISTVDQQAFCGNGVIDDGTNGTVNRNEQCEFIQGSVVKKENGVVVPAQCADQGTVQCLNNCTYLENKCVACGPSVQGVYPMIDILNPILAKWSQRPTTNWYTAHLYRPAKVSGNTIYSRMGLTDLSTTNLSKFGFTNSLVRTGPAVPLQVEQNLLCVDKYSLVFNTEKIQTSGSATTFNTINDLKADPFLVPIVTQAAGSVSVQDIIMSPAVPEGVFRVVLKWTDKNIIYNGSVFNDEYVSGNNLEDAVQSYIHRTLEMCDAMSLGSKNGANYWLPGADASAANNGCSGQGGVQVSSNQSSYSGKTNIQTFTIDTNGYSEAYTFFVEQINTLYFNALDGVEVLLYGHRPGQNGEFSVYQPTHTFKLKDVTNAGTTSKLRYWQVFNLVKDPATNKYKVEFVKEKEANGNPTGVEYSNGLFQSCSARVFSYLPNRPPVKCS